MKISIIGAGNVGGLTAMRLSQDGLSEILLVDALKNLVQGKAMDMQDAQAIVKCNYNIRGSDDLQEIKGSDIIVMTAGFPRKPGMTREELLNKNAEVLSQICAVIRKVSSQAVVLIVTNPLDLMTYFALKATGFPAQKVFGMGISLDAARFANLISQELNIPVNEIEACVIGSHGEGMLPLPRLTKVKDIALDEFCEKKKADALVKRTAERGHEIVSLLGSGSAYFAPSAAIAQIVKAVAKDEKRIIGVSAYLEGEYGIQGACIGVPCRIGKSGIENIIELELSKEEKELLRAGADKLKAQYVNLKI